MDTCERSCLNKGKSQCGRLPEIYLQPPQKEVHTKRGLKSENIFYSKLSENSFDTKLMLLEEFITGNAKHFLSKFTKNITCNIQCKT